MFNLCTYKLYNLTDYNQSIYIRKIILTYYGICQESNNIQVQMLITQAPRHCVMTANEANVILNCLSKCIPRFK